MTADVETGILYNRAGRRMLALTNDFLIGLHKALADECGEKFADVITHCGRKWGKNFAEGLDAEWSNFYKAPALEFPTAMFHSLLIQEFGHNGWGLLDIDYTHLQYGIFCVSLEGAIMSELMPEKTDAPADLLTAGILSGIFSHFLSQDLDCIQSQCARDGFSESRFIVAPTAKVAPAKEQLKESDTHDSMIKTLLDAAA